MRLKSFFHWTLLLSTSVATLYLAIFNLEVTLARAFICLLLAFWLAVFYQSIQLDGRTRKRYHYNSKPRLEPKNLGKPLELYGAEPGYNWDDVRRGNTTRNS